MIPRLTYRNPELVEWMDREDCDRQLLRNTYRYFPVINRLLSGWKTVYKQFIRPELSTTRSFRLLDVGSGGGDITRNLYTWAKKDGFRLDVTGTDPDSRALAFAGKRSTENLRFLHSDTCELIQKGKTYDFVVCNHVLHHLPDADVRPFLGALQQLATRRIICSDIERSQTGYLLFSLLTWPFFPNSFIRVDGLLSIRKSYTCEELRRVVPDHWSVHRQSPYRLLAICDIYDRS